MGTNPMAAKRREAFLAELALTANVAASARCAEVAEAAVYALRRKDEGFRRAWLEALAEGYAYGRLRWLDGPNGGLASDIAASAGDRLTLREAPAFAVDPGTPVELTEGCDRRFETCVARFANAANFRGEPHLPGNDLLTRYPGA